MQIGIIFILNAQIKFTRINLKLCFLDITIK